jgi:hypothetical protein
MNLPKYIFSAVLVALLTLTTTAIAQTQSPIFVSAKNGNDANPCTVEAPCKTFRGAMLLVAPGGEIVVLDSGEYGLLPITRPVSVIAPDGVWPALRHGFGVQPVRHRHLRRTSQWRHRPYQSDD